MAALSDLDLDPWDRLGRTKNLMFEVAEEVRSQLASKPAETTEAKHFRSLQALRAWRAGDELRVRLAVRSYPALAVRFPSPDLHDARILALCQHAQNLHITLLNEEEKELEASTEHISEETLEGARKKVCNRKELWKKMKRRTWLQGTIADGDGQSSSAAGAADELLQHWKSVFAAPEVDTSLWPELDSFIKPLSVPANATSNELMEGGWILGEVDWKDLLFRKLDSMPGEDGIPYSAWRVPAASDALYACYCRLFTHPTSSIPDDMKSAIMVFLPKKISEHEIGEGVFRKPEVTRPLSMTNTDCKLLSASMTVVLTRKIALSNLLRSPQKCFRGRDMIVNVIEAELFILKKHIEDRYTWFGPHGL